jgi:uncharacterized protein DUF3833
MTLTIRWLRLLRRGLLPLAAALLAACAAPNVADLIGRSPTLDLARYFDGDLVAHGMVLDRSGAVVRRFVVDLKGRWSGNDGTLDEAFRFDDGSTQQRRWLLTKGADGRYSGRAADVVGAAEGQAAGPALQWRYTLRLPVNGREFEVQFDDWMVLVDDQVLLNRATMSKFGIRIGEVVLAFRRR